MPAAPFTTFNFTVEIYLPSGLPDLPAALKSSGPLCQAAFAECDGLEMTMEVKTIREGGNNGKVIRLNGPVAYGTLTLKRGMSANFQLWDWFRASVERPTLRASAQVVMFGPQERRHDDDQQVQAWFVLDNCVPIKLKAPALNAKDGLVAIEEMQIAYESLKLMPTPVGGGNGGQPG